MTVTSASGPDPTDWLAGLLRGFLPLRLLLCLAGLALTGLSGVLALSLFGSGPPDLPGWWQQPIEHAQALREECLGGSLGRIVVRGGPLLALNTALWCLIGGWIARHELVARPRDPYDATEERVAPGATAFVAGWWKRLIRCCPGVLLILLVLLLPVLLVGWVCAWLGGMGALAASLLLPVLLVADLAVLVVALGAAAWPLMPVTLAAECGDEFDALARSYSYSLQRQVHFLLLTATALGLAGLPLGVLYCLTELTTDWDPQTHHTLALLAAALSASIFWSLETLVYLHLRAAIDGVEAREVAAGPPQESPKAPSPEGKAAEVPASGDGSPPGWGSRVRTLIQCLAAVTGSWFLTYWLLSRASGGRAEWMAWGLGDTFFPPGEGAYRVASVIAGLWGLGWAALGLRAGIRLFVSGRAPQVTGLIQQTESDPDRSSG
jgi:hypothetical protein